MQPSLVLRFLLLSWFQVCLVVLQVRSAAGMAKGYDDSRRNSCKQAMNKDDGAEDASLPTAESEYDNTMRMEVIEISEQRISYRIGFSDRNSYTTEQYKQACESAGNSFRLATGVLNCHKEGRRTTTVLVDNGVCFPQGKECQHYVDNPLEWQLNTYQLSYEGCSLWDGPLDDVIDTLLTDTPLPAGVPRFVDKSNGYNDARRQTCFRQVKKVIHDNGDLYSTAGHRNVGKQQIDLLQVSPILTQREWYRDDDDTNNNNHSDSDSDSDSDSWTEYQQKCEQANGTFDHFSGTLDCIGFGPQNRGEKTTLIVDGAATCFPPTGCEEYTLGQYRIDTIMQLSKQSCTIRREQSTIATQYYHNTGEWKLILILMVVVCALVTVYWKISESCHRGKRQLQRAVDVLELGEPYSDDNVKPYKDEGGTDGAYEDIEVPKEEKKEMDLPDFA